MLRISAVCLLLSVLVCSVDANNWLENLLEDNDEKEVVLKELENLILNARLFEKPRLSMKPPGYSEQKDNVFGDGVSDDNLSELIKAFGQEWETLIFGHNPDFIANKYTEDCKQVLRENGETEVHTGRDAIRELYKTWFDTYHYDYLTIDPETRQAGWLGDDYIWLINYVKFYNKNDEKVAGLTNVVLFKRTASNLYPYNDGWAIKLVVELRDNN